MRIDAITLFPEAFSVVRDAGITGRAHKQGLWSLQTWNPRDQAQDIHRTVDDRPYGGGPGMVMMMDKMPLPMPPELLNNRKNNIFFPSLSLYVPQFYLCFYLCTQTINTHTLTVILSSYLLKK